ncbi:ankyrin repeat and socs box-containing 3 [Holotrichia oblita]|uniref:Ankyrin repeat and socs box-containing 3 n=1 Tax=Holotrichia oblita TaxID=644536 RepID=A0ACB9TT84_HOLOL|nr:ankyrin repeat and socs box-containing 3 [Holotrichia oblita]
MPAKTDVLSFKEYISPLKSVINYVSLLNTSNDVVLSCYIFCLLIAILWFLWLTIRKILRPSVFYTHKLLYEAVSEKNNTKAIQIIRQCPATINMFYLTEGYTSFLKACITGNTQLVKYMIDMGADLNIRTPKNENPFYLAVYNHVKHPQSKDASCIHALYYAGADINAVNEKGYNALQLASSYGHTSLVKWLIEKGANLNVTPDPYFLARIQGHVKTALVVKNLRCKFNSTNNYGKSIN